MKWVSIGSVNGLSLVRHQAVTWTNTGLLSIGPLGTNFSEMRIDFSFTKTHLKMSSAKWRPFCPGRWVKKKNSWWCSTNNFCMRQYLEGQIGCFRTVTLVWIHQWLRNDAQSLKWHGRGALLCFKVIRQIARSHGSKILECDPNWAFPDCNSSLNSPMATKWCTKLEVAWKRCPIVFGHPSKFKVTRL